jgi:exonuclease III
MQDHKIAHFSWFNCDFTFCKKCCEAQSCAQNAVQQVDDFDREGRCLMLDLGSLVVFNVYVPHLKKPEESTRKLQFLNLLQKRVERVQSEGKMAIVCGDLNLTWRKADVHVNSLYVQVVENCIAGNSD